MTTTPQTITDDQIRWLLDAARAAGDQDTARACYAALATSEPIASSWTKDDARRHCAGAINAFVRGAQECREMMARFVEGGGDSVTAVSIRANWHPQWGPDPKRPQPAPDVIRCAKIIAPVGECNDCGCAETYPQLVPGRISHGPGCQLRASL